MKKDDYTSGGGQYNKNDKGFERKPGQPGQPGQQEKKPGKDDDQRKW